MILDVEQPGRHGNCRVSAGGLDRFTEFSFGLAGSPKDMDKKTKSEFLRLRGVYHTTGTNATKADRVKSIEQLLEDAKSDE